MSSTSKNYLLLLASSLFAAGDLWMGCIGKAEGRGVAALFGLWAGVACWQLRQANNVAPHASAVDVRVRASARICSLRWRGFV